APAGFLGRPLRLALLRLQAADLDAVLVEHLPLLLGVLRRNAIAVVDHPILIHPLVQRAALALGQGPAGGESKAKEQDRSARLQGHAIECSTGRHGHYTGRPCASSHSTPTASVRPPTRVCRTGWPHKSPTSSACRKPRRRSINSPTPASGRWVIT